MTPKDKEILKLGFKIFDLNNVETSSPGETNTESIENSPGSEGLPVDNTSTNDQPLIPLKDNVQKK